MDIKDSSSKITTCLHNNPCIVPNGFGGTACAAATSNKGGVVCTSCPTMYTADDDRLKDTDGWNVLSESCEMGSTHTVKSGTVKIKKSASMVGELAIDRGSDTSGINRHFLVYGTLEMEDVTLKGGHAGKQDVSYPKHHIFSGSDNISLKSALHFKV